MYSCKDCKFEAEEKSQSEKHNQDKHNEEIQLTFTCEICNSQFNKLQALRDHKAIHVRNFKCDKCMFIAKTQDGLNEHIKLGHQREMNCDMCNFTTNEKDELSEHEKDFHKILNYKCNFCRKVFKFTSELEEHKKLMHMQQERPTSLPRKKTFSHHERKRCLQVLEPVNMQIWR